MFFKARQAATSKLSPPQLPPKATELGVHSYLSEPRRDRRRWKGNTEAQGAVYANRRRIRGERDQAAVDALKLVIGENGKLHWEHERDEISRFLGFGCPDIDRVLDCTGGRATLIGWNTIHARQTDQFRVPLPLELEGVAGFRALSVTIAWLTPITQRHRMYRLAKLKAGPGSDKGFSLGVGNSKGQPSHNALGKGTIYHHRWEGEDASDFVDGGYLVLDVTCSPAAGGMDDAVPYAVAASLEVGADVAVLVYERIRKRLRESVTVRA